MPKPFYNDPRHQLLPVPFVRPLLLCVEDDQIYLHLRKAVLEQQGYNVIGVTTADDALETFREAPVCCVIADHMLQGQTGSQMAQMMKAIKPDVPIVLHSGKVPETIQGIDVYVNKGEPTETFLKFVSDVVQRYCS